ncbi:MAG: hypothetical protein P1Q69_09720 [Candidatus Thorarchaeota archaeon]|nr:hypothetical protein [Candidatus Thorarchaeota archaeon]
MEKRRKEMERMARLYMDYLNGPFGKKVLKGLKEGEGFSILSKEEVMKVTKERGKAIVRVEDRISTDIRGDSITNL